MAPVGDMFIAMQPTGRKSPRIAAADADLGGFCRDADGLASRLGGTPGLPCGTYRECWCGDA